MHQNARIEFQDSGCHFVNTEKGKKKETADMRIAVDMAIHALDVV